jgi:hypothetical protein
MTRFPLLLLGWAMLLVANGASKTAFDYELTAPGDFSEASFSIEVIPPADGDATDDNVTTHHEMNFRSDTFGIWISFADFEENVIKLFSIEDKARGAAYAYVNEAGAAERRTEPRGEVLAGTEIHLGEDDQAHGMIVVRLYPVGEAGWIDGEPVTVKLTFSDIGRREQ